MQLAKKAHEGGPVVVVVVMGSLVCSAGERGGWIDAFALEAGLAFGPVGCMALGGGRGWAEVGSVVAGFLPRLRTRARARRYNAVGGHQKETVDFPTAPSKGSSLLVNPELAPSVLPRRLYRLIAGR